ncbi:MAG: RNA polymerase sigma factor [Cyclobacteriaceae bacterium]|nr:RNA polymerase sigma factor [Cyclobacteriaceae bacterium]
MDIEKQLVEQCKNGDRNAQEKIYALFSRSMYVVCQRYSKSQLEAEDIMQESFIKVFKNIEQYRGDSTLGAWVKRIVINTALNSQRSKLYMFPMTDVKELENENDGDFSLSRFHLKELLAMIQSLPEGCQVVFNLFAIEGYSHKEIAEKLHISEGTSKSQYSRAKSLLRKMIEHEEKLSYERAR